MAGGLVARGHAVGVEGITRRDEIAQPAGSARISFVDARDVADVAVALLLEDRRAEGAFDLTGATAFTDDDVAAAIARVMQRPIRYRAPSDDEARVERDADGQTGAAIEARLGFMSVARRGVFSVVTPDAERVLGRPQRAPDAFASDQVGVWRKEVA